jgi:hypothetical protein
MVMYIMVNGKMAKNMAKVYYTHLLLVISFMMVTGKMILNQILQKINSHY